MHTRESADPAENERNGEGDDRGDHPTPGPFRPATVVLTATVTMESPHHAREQAGKHYRELPPGSPEAADALVGVDAFWEAYEAALGKAPDHGAVRRPSEPKE